MGGVFQWVEPPQTTRADVADEADVTRTLRKTITWIVFIE